jgi:hypothetical protein
MAGGERAASRQDAAHAQKKTAARGERWAAVCIA